MKFKNILIFFGLLLFLGVLLSSVFLGNITPSQIAKYAIAMTLLVGGGGLLAVLVVKQTSGDGAANGLLINLGVLVTTCSLLLIAGEYGLRYLYKDVTTTGDSRSYFEKRWLQKVHINRFGFREREFQQEASGNVYRIAVIGDSLTFGKGIDEKDRYSNLLEERLNASNNGKSYEVLNFGRPGANTIDETGILDEFVLPAKPDFIVLQWYKNDVIDNPARARIKETRRSDSRLSYEFDKSYTRLVDNSILFSLLDKQVQVLKKKLLSGTDAALTNFGDEQMSALFGDPDSVDSVRANSALEEFLAVARANDIPVGMVLFTDSYFRPSSGLDYLLERVVDLCAREHLICVDTRPLLKPWQGDHKLWASKLDPHPSAFANRITADEMFAEFGPLWLGKN